MKKIISNVMYQGIFQMLKIILPIVTIPIVSRALGPEGIGEFNYINSILSYFLIVAGLGMDMYGIREVAVVRNNKEKLSSKFWELQIFNGSISLIVILLYVTFSFFTSNSVLFLIQSLVLFGAMFDISWFFAGIEEFKAITLSNLFIKIISFVLIVSFINTSEDLVLYFVIQSASILMSQLVLWLFVIKKVSFVKISIIDSFSHFIPATNFFVGKIANTIYMNLNKTFLGLLGTISMVGIFSNATNLIFMFVALIGSVDTVMLPTMSNLHSEGSNDRLLLILKKSIHIQLFFTIPMVFGLIAISDTLVFWFFGPLFSEASLIIKLLSPIIIIKTLGTALLKQYLMPRNQIREFNISVIIGAGINIILNVILIPLYGMIGAVIATLVTECFVAFLRLYFVIKETSFSLNFLMIGKQLLSAGFMLFVLEYIFKDWELLMSTTFIQIAVGFTIYLILSLLFKFNPIFNLLSSNRKLQSDL